MKIKPKRIMSAGRNRGRSREMCVTLILLSAVTLIDLNHNYVRCDLNNNNISPSGSPFKSSAADRDSKSQSEYQNQYAFMPLNNVNKNPQDKNHVPDKMSATNTTQPVCSAEPMILAGNGSPASAINEDMLPKFKLLAEDNTGQIVHIQHDGLISLTCTGNKPVTWKFQGFLGVLEVIKSITIKRDSLDPTDKSTFCYTATMTLLMPRPIKFVGSGLYTCSYVQGGNSNNPQTQKSYYLYANDNLPNILAKPNLSSELTVNSFLADEIVVPCIGNWPNFTVGLTKWNLQGNLTELDPAKVKVVYNPKVGFTIQKIILGDSQTDLAGRYHCVTLYKGLKDDAVNVTVGIREGKKPERSNKISISVQDYGGCKRFVCLSTLELASKSKTKSGISGSNGNGNISRNFSISTSNLSDNDLELSVIKCSNPLKCQFELQFLNDGLDSPNFVKTMKESCGHPEDISPVNNGHYDPKTATTISILPPYKAGVVICRTRDKAKFQYSHFFRSVGPDGLIAGEKVLLDSGSVSIQDDRSSSGQFENLIRSDTEMIPKVEPEKVIHIDVPKEPIFVKQHHVLYCDMSNYLLANGSKWLVEYSNGTFGSPEILESKQAFKPLELQSSLHTTVNITTTDIVSFACLVPLWNSDEWINISHPVQVHEGTVPQFVNVPNDPNITVYDTDTNQALVCEASGEPTPHIMWYKNGEPFEDNSGNSYSVVSENGTSKKKSLHFRSVSFNEQTIAGIYVCNATNIKGTVLNPIQIKVKTFSLMKYLLPSVGVIFLFAVITLALFLYKFWRKSETQERYIQQLTKQEIQQFRYGRRSVRKAGLEDGDDCSTAGLTDYANLSRGVEHALDLPYDQKRFEISKSDLLIDETSCKLGEGNFGKVLKGILLQNSTRVPVAVKMLKQWDVAAAKMLLSEIKILALIGKHDNVVSLLGAVTNILQFKIQLVLEYCAEGSLELFLRQKRSLFIDEIKSGEIEYTRAYFHSSANAKSNGVSNYVKADYGLRTFDLVRWAHQFACAMEYVASKHIIHGDLAARNLLLTDKRDLKITDFGLARKLKDYRPNYIPSLSSTEREQPWRSLAIECWGDNCMMSIKSDVWAYGITLWEIFSLAQEPYARDYPIFTPDFSRNLLAGYRLSKPPHATNQIYQLMLNCWESNPNQRPEFSTFVQKFEKLLPGNYVKSLPPRDPGPDPVQILNTNNTNFHSQSSYIPNDTPQVIHFPPSLNVPTPQGRPSPNPNPNAAAVPVPKPPLGSYIFQDEMEQFRMEVSTKA